MVPLVCPRADMLTMPVRAWPGRMTSSRGVLDCCMVALRWQRETVFLT
jgi:hypothetical protein